MVYQPRFTNRFLEIDNPERLSQRIEVDLQYLRLFASFIKKVTAFIKRKVFASLKDDNPRLV